MFISCFHSLSSFILYYPCSVSLTVSVGETTLHFGTNKILQFYHFLDYFSLKVNSFWPPRSVLLSYTSVLTMLVTLLIFAHISVLVTVASFVQKQRWWKQNERSIRMILKFEKRDEAGDEKKINSGRRSRPWVRKKIWSQEEMKFKLLFAEHSWTYCVRIAVEGDSERLRSESSCEIILSEFCPQTNKSTSKKRKRARKASVMRRDEGA